ncbi:MAG: alpha-D-glucose phosphate-specific phosphoglucomutase [Moraxellaceae bacterium]|nr:MAG: alpha-D-glucose phosphate-specific phosphoglucomutase [Moraxellaceae bacterium]
MIRTVSTQSFSDQKPGTSGLRKKVKHVQQPHYLANFVQSMLDLLSTSEKELLIVGGDGRYYNDHAIQHILKIAAANQVRKVLVGRGGILSTPAVSNLIRHYGAGGGIILSASHNPGGPEGDFGIKFNNSNGSPAPESFTDALYERTQKITQFHIFDVSDIDISTLGNTELNNMVIEVIDPVTEYSELMSRLFDFQWLKKAFSEGSLSLAFDAMHAVTGPYAKTVFVDELGAPSEAIINGVPLEDFGGEHPDPNLVHAKALIQHMSKEDSPLLGAASDGDGDRNLILGQDIFVSPSDSLAVIAEYSHLIPQFEQGLSGVARSMPTSTALDRVALDKGIPCFETPTGWKFFGNLLDAGKINLCGEESFGTGADHIREKDGIWTVLCWLTICGQLKQSPKQILAVLWNKYGRSYYCRYDYENIPQEKADIIMSELAKRAEQFTNTIAPEYIIDNADSFSYSDPVDGSVSKNQGIRLVFRGGHRIVYRLSGTGTGNATLRVYLEKIETDADKLFDDVFDTLSSLGRVADAIAGIEENTGMKQPTVKT